MEIQCQNPTPMGGGNTCNWTEGGGSFGVRKGVAPREEGQLMRAWKGNSISTTRKSWDNEIHRGWTGIRQLHMVAVCTFLQSQAQSGCSLHIQVIRCVKMEDPLALKPQENPVLP